MIKIPHFKRIMLRKKCVLLIISSFLAILGISLSFIGGIFSSDGNVENSAYYASQMVKDQTKNKEYAAFYVDRNEETNLNIERFHCENEFNNLYGIFAETKATFAPVYNSDKKINAFCEYIDSTVLSFLYVGNYETDKPYYDNKGIEHIKHNLYPIDFMFDGYKDNETIYDQNKYCVYISESQASKILEKQGCAKENKGYTLSDYEELIQNKTQIYITVESSIFTFVISNIFYERGYYCDALNDVVGEYVIVPYNVPEPLFSNLNYLYFLKSFVYQNYYMMKYIKTQYNNEDFSFGLNHYNIKNQSEINFERLESFLHENSNSLLSTLFIILTFLSLLFSLFLIFRAECFGLIDMIVLAGGLLFPYLLFKLLFLITDNVLLFTYHSTKANVFGVLFFVFIYSILFLINNFRSRYKSDKGIFYEFDV